MSTSPDYNVIVRRSIERYRTFVQEAPRVEHQAPAGLVPIIAKLVAANERDGVLFRGEARYPLLATSARSDGSWRTSFPFREVTPTSTRC